MTVAVGPLLGVSCSGCRRGCTVSSEGAAALRKQWCEPVVGLGREIALSAVFVQDSRRYGARFMSILTCTVTMVCVVESAFTTGIPRREDAVPRISLWRRRSSMRGVKLVQVAVNQGHDRQVESGRPDGPNIVHGGGYQLSQAVAALGSWSLGYLRW